MSKRQTKPVAGGLSHRLTRFFETLGIADDPVWRGPQDGEITF